MLHGIQNRLKFHLHIRPLVMGSTGRYPVHNQRSSFSPHSQPNAGVHPQNSNPNRAVRFAGAGGRRPRASSLQLAWPPVATRNGPAPPRRIGAPATPEKPLNTLLYTHQHPKITHKLPHSPVFLPIASMR
jgi:hypothetical protein